MEIYRGGENRLAPTLISRIRELEVFLNIPKEKRIPTTLSTPSAVQTAPVPGASH